MKWRIFSMGCLVVAAGMASGCGCRKWCCRPACPAPCPPTVAASPAPCCPPGGATVPPGVSGTQFFSGPPAGAMGAHH